MTERADLTRLGAFAGLCALAAWRYAGVEVRPPTLRVLALVAVAVVAGAALMRVRQAAGRVIVIVLLLAIALLAAGVPARLLLPLEWGSLVRHVRGGLNTVAGWAGVETYPPAVLFAVAALFVILVLLHYSTVISKLADQNTVLAQRLALLEQQLDERAGAD